MARKKFLYNPDTLRYEHRKEPLARRILRAGLGVSASVAVGFGIMVAYTSLFATPRSHALRRDINDRVIAISMLRDRVNSSARQLAIIENRDNNLYRTIFEADTIAESIREGGIGGVERYGNYLQMPNGSLLRDVAQDIDRLTWRAYVQSKSFDDVARLAYTKDRMVHCVPAIQPVSVQQLTRMSSLFGYRSDPFTHVAKMHTGLDFVGRPNTPIHATGDGLVVVASMSTGGYGRQVVIDHGFGYKTRYAHMSSISVVEGERVKRGQEVGKMGSTGRSTGTHLHYEVLVKNRPVNPALYFSDVSEEEYEDMLANAQLQQMD